MSFEQFAYLKTQLISKYEFEEEHAEDAANRLIRDNRIYEAVASYIHTGNIADIEIAGQSVSSLVNEYNLEPIGAYLMMVEFAADPVTGEMYLARLRENGHHVPIVEDGEIRGTEFSSVPAADQTPKCPKCGKDVNWIEQYQRWYCQECKQYI